jgi:cytochrome c-type biogenesis protein CcsB
MDSAHFFGIAEVAYILAMIGYISHLIFKIHSFGFISTIITAAGFLSQTNALIMRWIESYEKGFGHAPLTNLYESLVFFVWCLILGYLILEFKYKNRTFGAFVTPIAGLVLLFIDLTGMSKEIQPLVPALQSNWLLVHVMMSFLSYAAFGISFSSAIMYLILSTSKRNEPAYIFWTVIVSVFIIALVAMILDWFAFSAVSRSQEDMIKSHLFEATFRNPAFKIPIYSTGAHNIFINLTWFIALGLVALFWRFGYLLKGLLEFFKIPKDVLEDITYKSVAVGFPIFTLGGLIFGAIWADQAWGVYWSWDPKETWSLITWIVYAVYLHARYIGGWRGKKVAILSAIGFVSVMFTYLGVNLALSGLHSYGSS